MITLGRYRRTSAQPLTGGLAVRRVPMILMYHGVADVAEDPNQLFVTPGRFAEQMGTLQRLGLRGVSVGTLIDAMRVGRHGGLVGITFDDGYVSVLEAAVPELRRRSFTATVFIIADRLGGTNEWDDGLAWPLLSGGQVTELAAAGMEIGSHGATHVRLAGADAGRLDAEIAGSRTSLGELIGAPVQGFAYPYGSMDAPARRTVAEGRLRLRLRCRDSGGYPRAHGAATDLRRPARRGGPADGQATSLPGLHHSQGESARKVLHVITGLDVGGAEETYLHQFGLPCYWSGENSTASAGSAA